MKENKKGVYKGIVKSIMHIVVKFGHLKKELKNFAVSNTTAFILAFYGPPKIITTYFVVCESGTSSLPNSVNLCPTNPGRHVLAT